MAAGLGLKFWPQRSIPAGSFIVPQRHPYYVLVRGATVLQRHGEVWWTITYVDPTDDPTKK